MAASVVQHKEVTSGTSATFTSATTSGNQLVVVAWSYNTSLATNAITDNKGNTFTQRAALNTGVTVKVAIYDAGDTPTMGSSHQISIAAGTDQGFCAFEVNNLTTSAFDKSSTSRQTTTSQTSGATATLTQADEIWFAAVCSDQGNTDTITPTAPTGWNQANESEAGNTEFAYNATYGTVNATTALTATWTFGGSHEGAAIIGTYKAAAGGSQALAATAACTSSTSGSLNVAHSLAASSAAGVASTTGALTIAPPRVAYVKEVGFVTNTTAGTTSAITVAAGGVPVGDTIVIYGACDNTGSSGVATTISVADNSNNAGTANTYTLQTNQAIADPGAASAGQQGFFVVCPVTRSLDAGDTITITYGNSTTAKAINAQQFTGVNTTTPVLAATYTTQDNQTGTTSSVAATATAFGQAVCALVAVEGGTADSYTEDSDTTNGSWVTLTRRGSGTTTSGSTLNSVYKIVNASGAQTYNPTLGTSRDHCSAILILAVAPQTQALAGTVAATSTTTANLKAAHSLASTSAATSTTTGALSVPSNLPLATAVSSSGRYLVDQFGNPYFIQGASPQLLCSKASSTTMDSFFSDQSGRGINSVQVHLMANESIGANSGSLNINGDAPFSTMSTLSTPVEAYWTLVDTMFSTAETYGITVWASPCENISYGATLASMTDAQCITFGEFIGARYRDLPNVIWSFGNDYQSGQWSASESKYRKVIEGMQNATGQDTHLVTLWLNYTDSISTDIIDVGSYTNWETLIDVNLGYSYTLSYYQMEKGYTRTGNTGDPRPVFFGEGNYEGEHLHAEFGEAATTNETLRRTSWWAVTSGGCGNFFGQHTVWDCSDLTAGTIGSTASDQNELVSALVTSYSRWKDLAPDTTSTVLTGGRGTHSTAENLDPLDNNYASCAYTPGLMIAYFPTSRGSITVDTSDIGTSPVAEWWDPTLTIAQTPVSEATPSAPTHPGTNNAGQADWVLIITADVVQALAGTVTGASSTTGALKVTHTLEASSAATSATSSALKVAHSLSGTVTCQSATTGAVNVAHGMVATTTPAATTTATLSIEYGSLSSTATTVSQVQGSLRINHPLNVGDSVAAQSVTTGDLDVRKLIAGSAAAAATTAGALAVARPLSGLSAAASTTVGAVGVLHSLVGSSAVASTTTGALTVTGANDIVLEATATAVSATSAAIVVARSLAGQSSAQSSTTAATRLAAALASSVAVQSATSASLTVPGGVPFGPLLGSPEFYSVNTATEYWNDGSYRYWDDFTP